MVAHTHGRRGNKSVPPTVIVRMMLLPFLDDIKSERELIRIIPELLYYLWKCGSFTGSCLNIPHILPSYVECLGATPSTLSQNNGTAKGYQPIIQQERKFVEPVGAEPAPAQQTVPRWMRNRERGRPARVF